MELPIKIPRPAPGVVALVVVDENGAIGRCELSETLVAEGLPEIIDLLHDAQHQLWVQTQRGT